MLCFADFIGLRPDKVINSANTVTSGFQVTIGLSVVDTVKCSAYNANVPDPDANTVFQGINAVQSPAAQTGGYPGKLTFTFSNLETTAAYKVWCATQGGTLTQSYLEVILVGKPLNLK